MLKDINKLATTSESVCFEQQPCCDLNAMENVINITFKGEFQRFYTSQSGLGVLKSDKLIQVMSFDGWVRRL